ncbi:MAG TPA: hypothetical protein PK904_15905, partial [Bacteroidales bacterium]|nr:hypothetical protein [Bacteroidales bacterium]
FSWDSALVSGTTATNSGVSFKVYDFGSETDADSTSTLGFDIVPYITGIKRSSDFTTNRSRLGGFILRQGEDVTVAMYPNSGDAVTMILSKTPETKIKLVVKSDNDEVLYQKQFKKIDNTRVKYDISEFPSGEYTFEVVQGKDVLYSQKFSKRDGTLAIAE